MKALRIHYLQHIHFEGPGCIADWATNKGHNLSSTKFYEGEELPKLDAIDWLIIMGGPMNVNDEADYPWLKAEKAFIKEAIAAGKKIIGICLGSQLIASVLGSNVYPNTVKEIGWWPVQPVKQSNNVLFNGSDNFTVFHWHGDTFDLPEKAELLAFTSGCANQAFTYKNTVLGLQFHLEVTEELLSQMLIHGRHELVNGKYIQDQAAIKSQSHLIEGNNQRMYSLLSHFEAL